jgi:hypothetical protein
MTQLLVQGLLHVPLAMAAIEQVRDCLVDSLGPSLHSLLTVQILNITT